MASQSMVFTCDQVVRLQQDLSLPVMACRFRPSWVNAGETLVTVPQQTETPFNWEPSKRFRHLKSVSLHIVQTSLAFLYGSQYLLSEQGKGRRLRLKLSGVCAHSVIY